VIVADAITKFPVRTTIGQLGGHVGGTFWQLGGVPDWPAGQVGGWQLGGVPDWPAGQVGGWQLGGVPDWPAGQVGGWQLGGVPDWPAGQVGGGGLDAPSYTHLIWSAIW